MKGKIKSLSPSPPPFLQLLPFFLPMMQALPNVLLIHLCHFMPWIDTYALRLSCRTINTILKPCKQLDLTRILKHQLNRYAPRNLPLVLYAFQGRICLTGSFVLQAMFGGLQCPWRAQDLDLLVDANDKPLWRAAQELLKQERSVSSLRGYTKPVVSVSFLPVGTKRGRNLAEVYRGESLTYASLADFIARESDLAFCHVLFDGVRVRIHNLQAMWSRTSAVSVYKFHRLPNYSYGDDGNEIVARMVQRVEKYTQRGFTIFHNIPPTQEARDQLNAYLLRERDIELTRLGHKAIPWSIADPTRILRNLPYNKNAIRTNVIAYEATHGNIPSNMRVTSEDGTRYK
jgi:hypothetical protein